MRIVILTSAQQGFASLCLPYLLSEPSLDLAMVVFSEGKILHPWRHWRRRLRKVLRIGLFGAVNALRLRPWYGRDVYRLLAPETLDSLASQHGFTLMPTPTINTQTTRDLLNSAKADIGLSFENSFIAPSVFKTAKYGMLNIHHEILPHFKGAQSVIWQIYHGSLETGYSIHRVVREIDAGEVLYQERMPIDLRPTLRETVTHTYAKLLMASCRGLVELLNTLPTGVSSDTSHVDQTGPTYTTPTYSQFRRMLKQHRRLYEASLGKIDKN